MPGPTVIRLKANTTAGVVPSGAQLQVAELALNVGDGKLYSEMANGTVLQIAQPVIGPVVSYVSGISYTSSNTDPQSLDEFAIAAYRSAEWIVVATDNDNLDYHAERAVGIHDGTTGWVVEYGVAFSNQSLMALTADVSAGNYRLRVTPTSANTTFRLTRTVTVV